MSEGIDWDFLKKVYCKDCDDNEFEVFKHLCEQYELDPISKEIWCLKTSKSSPARIFVSRDGHLAIAHRTGKFGSIETVFDWGDVKQYMDVKDKYGHVSRVLVPFSATCIIYRNDNPNPTKQTVYWDEYGSNTSLWASKPKTMLQKVAECQGLRRAFNMHGFYSDDEINNDLPGLDAVSTPTKSVSISTSSKTDSSQSSSPTIKHIDEGKKVDSKPSTKEVSLRDRSEAVTNAAFDIYNEKGMKDAQELFRMYAFNEEIFEKAKVGDCQWNKNMILADYHRQMELRGEM